MNYDKRNKKGYQRNRKRGPRTDGKRTQKSVLGVFAEGADAINAKFVYQEADYKGLKVQEFRIREKMVTLKLTNKEAKP